MGDPINENINPLDDPFTDPVSYNPSTLTHTVYSEDFNLVGQ